MQTDPSAPRNDLDLYAYTGDDPVNGTDPTGHHEYRAGMMIFCRRLIFIGIQTTTVEALRQKRMKREVNLDRNPAYWKLYMQRESMRQSKGFKNMNPDGALHIWGLQQKRRLSRRKAK